LLIQNSKTKFTAFEITEGRSSSLLRKVYKPSGKQRKIEGKKIMPMESQACKNALWTFFYRLFLDAVYFGTHGILKIRSCA
jgi:hypothetical protein